MLIYIVTTVYHMLSFVYFRVAKNLIVSWLSYKLKLLQEKIYSILYEFRKET